MTTETKPDGRKNNGGKRPGAGNKPKDPAEKRKPVTVYLDPIIYELAKKRIKWMAVVFNAKAAQRRAEKAKK